MTRVQTLRRAALALALAACSPLPVIDYIEQKLLFDRSPEACTGLELRVHSASVRVVRGPRARMSGSFRVRAPGQDEANAWVLAGQLEEFVGQDGIWRVCGRCPPGCPLSLCDYELRIELPRGVRAMLQVDEGLVVIDAPIPVLEVVTQEARVVARLEGGSAGFALDGGELRLCGMADSINVTADSATVSVSLATVPGYRLFLTTESGFVDEQMRVDWTGPKPPPGVARIAEIGPGPPGAVRLTTRSGRIVLRELQEPLPQAGDGR
jgi:hypothetical protein